MTSEPGITWARRYHLPESVIRSLQAETLAVFGLPLTIEFQPRGTGVFVHGAPELTPERAKDFLRRTLRRVWVVQGCARARSRSRRFDHHAPCLPPLTTADIRQRFQSESSPNTSSPTRPPACSG